MNENKKIAINTIVLTVKLVISVLCSFVVSRLVLQALGADNYGLYNVVGGVVALLSIVATSMVATTYRFIAVELGKGDKGDPQRIYSTLTLIHTILAIIVLVVGIPLGIFYINNYLNITSASIEDAYFVYIFSLVATFFTIIAVPSNGLLVAEEKFIPSSLIEILKSLLNIVAAFILLKYVGNRLRLYAVLMTLLTVANRIAFQLYCYYKYRKIVKFKFNKNRDDYKKMTAFTGWMLLGSTAVVGRTQGVAVVINLFFRNSINAAFGVANQIWHAAMLFTKTLRQSVTPQIMKNHEENSLRSLNLVYAISRYTFLFMLVICIPLLLCMNFILELWLGENNIPEMTSLFASFLLIDGLVASLRAGFDASIQASGNIRKNQIGYTIINLSIIPIVYILYILGFPAYINVIVGVFLSLITNLFQASVMKELTEFTYNAYMRKTILPALYSTIVSFIPMWGLRLIIRNSISSLLFFIVVSLIWTCSIVFFLGLSKRERGGIFKFIKEKIKK